MSDKFSVLPDTYISTSVRAKELLGVDLYTATYLAYICGLNSMIPTGP